MLPKLIKCTLFIFIIFFTFTLHFQAQTIVSKVLPCLQYKKRQCIRCPETAHLYEQQCYQNIPNCTELHYGTCSAVCKSTLNSSSQTLSTTTITTTTIVNNTSTTSSTTTRTITQSMLVNGQSIFVQFSVSQSLKDSLFILCNNFMRRGQYSHFISRTQNPIQSVFQSTSKGFRDFKILYEGSGGNLLMCIIGINIQTKAIILRSFVTIGRTQIIDFCVDYTATTQCNRCREGYHLDNSSTGSLICVPDIPACVEYFRNICVKCRGHYLLIENRCVSDCQSLRDSRSLKFYGNYDMAKVNNIIMDISRDYFV